MKNISKTLMAVLAVGLLGCGLFVQKAQAILSTIDGDITFAGTASLNTGSAGTATAVTGWHFAGTFLSPYVAGADGDFAPLVGSFATFTSPWTFGSGQTALWSVGIYTFDLTSSSIASQGFSGGLGHVTVNGVGIVHGTGFADTFGTWNFSTQDPGAGSPATFSFSAATAAVPDSGSTVALLGFVLAGVEGLRRTLKGSKTKA